MSLTLCPLSQVLPSVEPGAIHTAPQQFNIHQIAAACGKSSQVAAAVAAYGAGATTTPISGLTVLGPLCDASAASNLSNIDSNGFGGLSSSASTVAGHRVYSAGYSRSALVSAVPGQHQPATAARLPLPPVAEMLQLQVGGVMSCLAHITTNSSIMTAVK